MGERIYETASAAAAAIGVTQATISRWFRDGRLKAERVPRGGKDALRIRHADLIEASRGTLFEQPELHGEQMRLDTPEDLKRDALSLEVLWPDETKASRFSLDLLAGFASFRALTYSVSIPSVLKLLTNNDYQHTEVIFGCEQLVRESDGAKVTLLQKAIEDQLSQGYIGIGGVSDPRTQQLMEWQTAGRANFYAVAGGVVHSKVYLLEKPGLRRVLVGSANLSERAFSGRQGEVLVAYDNHAFMWESMVRKYEAVSSLATRLQLAQETKPAHLVKADDLPVSREAKQSQAADIQILRFDATDLPGDPEFVAIRAADLDSHLGEGLRDYIKPAPKGVAVLPLASIRKVNNAVAPKPAGTVSQMHSLEYLDGRFIHDGRLVERPDATDGMEGDALLLIQFINKFRELGERSDILQRHYFALMGWMYFSPFIPKLSHRLYLDGANATKTIPNLAVVYGQSNCGKSALIRFLYTSMFGPPSTLSNKEFTQSAFTNISQHIGILPVVYQDVEPTKFYGRGSAQAELIAKYYDQLVSVTSRYPCVVVSANAGPTEFANEVRNRAFLVYTPKGIASDDPETIKRIDNEVKPWFNRIGQEFYAEYLHRMGMVVETVEDVSTFDFLSESTTLIRQMLRETLLYDEDLPAWAKPLSANDYNAMAWELKHRQMAARLDGQLFTTEYPPAVGRWTATDTDIIIGVESVRDVYRAKEIQDHWIRNESTYHSGKFMVLVRDEVEDSIRRSYPEWSLPVPYERGVLARVKAMIGKV